MARGEDTGNHPGRKVTRVALSNKKLSGLAGAVNDPNIGGFTVHASGPNVGQQPTNAYSVGAPEHGRQHSLPLSTKQLGQYVGDKSSVLASPRRGLGGWQEGGQAHLDAPRFYPDTPVGDSAARHATLRGNEKAFGVLGSESEGYMGDVNNPWHEKFADSDITPGNPDDAKVWADMPRHTGVTSLEAKRRHPRPEY